VLLPGSRFLSAFHGLPGNQALALAEGAALFVGTPTGLGAIAQHRVAWRVTAGEGRLPHPWITALALHGGALFVGTYGGGVTVRTVPVAQPLAVGSFSPFPETAPFKVNTGCLVEAGGRLYLGTDGHGLWRLAQDGSRFQRIRAQLPSPRVTAILEGPNALYVGTDEGLARIALPIPDEGS
jgi:ligand-binding sensor domain-containing protein